MMIPSPAGMSLGKYHGLVWTEDGRIFGWGCKNLGLGLRHYDRVNLVLDRVFMMNYNKLIYQNQ